MNEKAHHLAGFRTHNLLIPRPALYHCATTTAHGGLDYFFSEYVRIVLPQAAQ